MGTCFVIQPFDGGKFDKRFNDVYRPAIEGAGLRAYRVDQDPGVSVPIDSIEEGIRRADICLADITMDNPNVWYELGFAFASRKPVVMVCSEERVDKKYPFDIQHRTVILYKTESPSDFATFKTRLIDSIGALMTRDSTLERLSESNPIVKVKGLSQIEMIVLGVIGSHLGTSGGMSIYEARDDAERAGITRMGYNIALRNLIGKKYIISDNFYDEIMDDSYLVVRLTEDGWRWIEENQDRFVLHTLRKDKDELPF